MVIGNNTWSTCDIYASPCSQKKTSVIYTGFNMALDINVDYRYVSLGHKIQCAGFKDIDID